MAPTIQLDKRLVLTLYCCVAQAYRSVHRSLCNPWADLQRYYAGERIQVVREVLRQLQAKLPASISHPGPLKAAIIWREWNEWNPLHILRIFFGKWITRWQSSWDYTVEELHYLACTLRKLVRTLEEPDKPSAEDLIAFRMELCDALGLIEMPCVGLEELERASRIEHFDRTKWFPHLRLEEIVPPLESKHRDSGAAA